MPKVRGQQCPSWAFWTATANSPDGQLDPSSAQTKFATTPGRSAATASPYLRGFGETEDGLHVKALPPLRIDYEGTDQLVGYTVMGGVACIGDRWYAML